MFTGIIEEIGILSSITALGNGVELNIKAHSVLESTKIGDSIAVNGICLTVVSIDTGNFKVQVVKETVNRTSLVEWRSGQQVNLERALLASGRLDGHFVQGHVDGTGLVVKVESQNPGFLLTITPLKELQKFIIQKGSIAVDGVSLTVASKSSDKFSIAIIPHTSKETTLVNLKPGMKVNLETDILGKYVYQYVSKHSDNDGISNKMLNDFGY